MCSCIYNNNHHHNDYDYNHHHNDNHYHNYHAIPARNDINRFRVAQSTANDLVRALRKELNEPPVRIEDL